MAYIILSFSIGFIYASLISQRPRVHAAEVATRDRARRRPMRHRTRRTRSLDRGGLAHAPTAGRTFGESPLILQLLFLWHINSALRTSHLYLSLIGPLHN